MSLSKIAFDAKIAVAGRDSTAALQGFVAADAMSADELEDLSRRRALRHAVFAFEHTRFYRDHYRSCGIERADLDDPAVLDRLPVVEKTQVREHFDAIRSDEASAASTSVSKTGGSTGLPLHILRDLRFPARALEWRLFRWWGVEPWENRAIVTRHMLHGFARRRHSLEWLPSRRLQLDAFAITDDTVREFAAGWERVRPTVVVGYTGGVLETARRLRSAGLSLLPPRAVAVTAAPLTDGAREEIADVFGAPVHDHYRSAEVPWIGGECEAHQGLHVFADVRRVEILGDDGKTVPERTEGQVIVTDLTNRAFPLIRYRLGDLSSLRRDTCACGRSLPRLGPIVGRSSDAVVLPDGTTISGALGHIFDDDPLAVRQFEILQARDYSVLLRCVSATGDANPGINRARAKLAEALRGQVALDLELVDEIHQDGGKMRFIRSEAADG